MRHYCRNMWTSLLVLEDRYLECRWLLLEKENNAHVIRFVCVFVEANAPCCIREAKQQGFGLHTWNSSSLRSNLLQLQCNCCTVPTTSTGPHGSPLVWACHWPSSQPLSSFQLSHNEPSACRSCQCCQKKKRIIKSLSVDMLCQAFLGLGEPACFHWELYLSVSRS